jgi:hypothetical protein
MEGPEYIDEVHDLLQGITLNEFSLFVAAPLTTHSFFEDSTMPREERFTELSLDIDGDNPMDQGDIPTATEHVVQNSVPAMEAVSDPNAKRIVKR